MTEQEYKQKRAEIDDRISNLINERTTLDREYALTLTDIRVGDTIEYGCAKRYIGVVDGVELYCNKAKFAVRRIRKNGSLSDSISEVYPYHNPKKIDI